MEGSVETTRPPKSRRKLILRGLSAILTLAAVVGVWRQTSLRGLPDIAPPFDRTRDGIIDLRDEDNAFTYYLRAHKLFGNEKRTFSSNWANWEGVDPAQLKFIDDNQPALASYFEGTKRARGVNVQPGKLTFETVLPAVQYLREFARAGCLLAYRYEHKGNYAKAWEWYRANLRASRHAGQNGVSVERLGGIALYALTSRNVRAWADNPQVDVALLKSSLKDLIELDALTPRVRDTIRAEYFSFANTLEDREILAGLLLSDPKLTAFQKLGKKALLAYGTVIREPERSQRVLRLVVDNWLSTADEPVTERLKRFTHVDGVPLYTPAPGKAPTISLDSLGAWNETTVYARMFLSSWASIDKYLLRDEQARAALIVHLAEQAYLREHGNPVESPQDVVGPYLTALPAAYDPKFSLNPPAAPAKASSSLSR